MKERLKTTVGRRDLLRATISGAATATMTAVARGSTAAEPASRDEKRKARYQSNSAEVQAFYRVNRYPAR
jgi:hypothetical protein